MPELTITSPYVHSRVDYNTFTTGNPMPESTLTLCQSRPYPFARVAYIPPSQGLWIWPLVTGFNDSRQPGQKDNIAFIMQGIRD
jgi:hypothetical protein